MATRARVSRTGARTEMAIMRATVTLLAIHLQKRDWLKSEPNLSKSF